MSKDKPNLFYKVHNSLKEFWNVTKGEFSAENLPDTIAALILLVCGSIFAGVILGVVTILLQK